MSVFPAFRSSRWFRCYCIAAAPLRVRESSTSVLSSPVTVSLVSAPADAVITVRARILPVTRSPVCVAAVFDAVDAAIYFSIVFECRCWNRLGRHGSSDSVKRRIKRFTETSGIKIRAFLADAELFLTLCSRPRDCWGFFVIAWLGSEEAEKIRRLHVADTVASYEKFRDGLITLLGRFEFKGAYRSTLRYLRQSGSESVAAYAALTTDLCSHAYAEFSTKAQLSLAVDHVIAGLADSFSDEYYNASERSAHSSGSKLCKSRKQAKHHSFRIQRPLPPLSALHTTRAIPLRHSLRVKNQTQTL